MLALGLDPEVSRSDLLLLEHFYVALFSFAFSDVQGGEMVQGLQELGL